MHGLKGRDPRVDFFRGLAFIIILIAHVPANWLAQWIPARFGFSDATEMFVFMSGYAAGIAFGGTYLKVGWSLGAARTLHRTWQVYIGHLLLFFFVLMILSLATNWLGTRDYVARMGISYFFNNGTDAIVGLFTLGYVPNFFDILPMYIVILLMMPIFMALGRIHPLVALGACVALYLYNWFTSLYHLPIQIQFPAEVRPDSDRPWFFNPFGWQLIFFTGFALSIGWLKPPRFSWWLVGLAVAMVVVGLLLGRWQIRNDVPLLREIYEAIHPKSDFQDAYAKTNFWVMRYLHFLALAYLTVNLLRGREHWLNSKWAAPIAQCGRQSLPVFLFGMAFSVMAGIMLDQIDIDHWQIPVWQVVLVNLFWIGMLIGLAYLLGWLQKTPWKAPRRPAADPAPTGAAPAAFAP
ncbi:MAG: OpgC family protein [Alphaproteobacteria bacterium]